MRRSKKQSRALVKKIRQLNNVLVDEPHIQSRASYILLIDKLMKLDEDFLSRFKWLKFRDAFLIDLHSKTKNLICEYCGKQYLRIFSKNTKILATIDHIVPLSKGGRVLDKNNFAIACGSCNSNKGSQEANDFKRKKKWETTPLNNLVLKQKELVLASTISLETKLSKN